MDILEKPLLSSSVILRREVVLFESPEIEIIPAEYDSNVFDSLKELVEDVNLYGYYGVSGY